MRSRGGTCDLGTVSNLPELFVVTLSHRVNYVKDEDGNYKPVKSNALVIAELDGFQLKVENTEYSYDCYAIVNHHQEKQDGAKDWLHYTTYARNGFDGDWFHYDDVTRVKVSADKVLTDSTYMLFFQKSESFRIDKSTRPNTERNPEEEQHVWEMKNNCEIETANYCMKSGLALSTVFQTILLYN